ncbi:MAG: holo-ACP synthase [Eggerthellaceae bacterium]|nr:holo-ACP synthase [Eggerthellaceae bacterium]
MERILARTPRFKMRVFTEGERAYCERTSHPATHYATRFAAKEAVLKALGTGFSGGIGPQDVEVTRTSKGRPGAKLHRKAAQEAKAQGVVDLPISLSFTHAEAVACAMAITIDSLDAAARRKDPMAELSRQFKEARLMLDDLPATGVGKADAGADSSQVGDGEEATDSTVKAQQGAEALDGVSATMEGIPKGIMDTAMLNIGQITPGQQDRTAPVTLDLGLDD